MNIGGWALVVLVALLAEAGVRLLDLHDSVAAPSATLLALVDELSSGTLSGEIATTLESFAQGLALAVALGVALGLAIGSSRTLLDATFVVIEFLRPIPAVAFIPVAILFFGLDTPMRRCWSPTRPCGRSSSIRSTVSAAATASSTTWRGRPA